MSNLPLEHVVPFTPEAPRSAAKRSRLSLICIGLGATFLLVSCATVPGSRPLAGSVATAPPAGVGPESAPTPPSVLSAPDRQQYPLLRPAAWRELPGWSGDDLRQAWPAWLQSCRALREKPGWQRACQAAAAVDGRDPLAIRAYFENHFLPWQATNSDGSDAGTVTGYFEPIIRGDRVRTERARYPIYAQ
ncbi:hypothetical protein FDZ71_18385, partial [bacterium]